MCTRKRLGTPARVLAMVLAVGIHWVTFPAFGQTDPASVAGQILAGDGDAPLAGVKVHLADARSGELSASAETDGNGSFRVAEISPATYSLAVETSQGLFISPTPIAVQPSQDRFVRVSIYQQESPENGGIPSDDNSSGGTGFWNNPLTATLVVLGIAVVVGVVVNEATSDDSPPPAGSPAAP